MSSQPEDGGTHPLNRRQFLDILSKSVIATTAFCLVAMTDSAAEAGKPKGQPGGKKGPAAAGANPYNAYCVHNPYPPYAPYHPYGPPPPHNPYNPYRVYNPYSPYQS